MTLGTTTYPSRSRSSSHCGLAFGSSIDPMLINAAMYIEHEDPRCRPIKVDEAAIYIPQQRGGMSIRGPSIRLAAEFGPLVRLTQRSVGCRAGLHRALEVSPTSAALAQFSRTTHASSPRSLQGDSRRDCPSGLADAASLPSVLRSDGQITRRYAVIGREAHGLAKRWKTTMHVAALSHGNIRVLLRS